jgi:SulP family sulfate permease
MQDALEWCETRLLEGVPSAASAPHTLTAQLAEGGLGERDAARLSAYLDSMTLTEGQTLIRQGEAASDLYLIERGQLSAYVEIDGKRMRVQTLRPGVMVGELSFILDQPRSASVIADEATTVHRLSREALAKIAAEDAPLAIAVNGWIGRLLTERLAAANRERAALSR